MKKVSNILTAVLIICCGLAFPAAAQTLTASVNRPEVPQGEVVMLSLEYAGHHTDEKPDLSVLQPKFNIFSMGQEFQNIYDNGKNYQAQTWNIGLMPKGTGKIIIPSIRLGKLSSQPVEINVVPATAAVSQNTPDAPRYAMKAEIDTASPFVQQEVNLTVTIFDAGSLQGGAPYFDAQNDWNILALGEPELESKVINGRSVRLIKFKYALFPQKSGRLTVPSAKFDGYYLTGRRRADPIQQLLDRQFGDMGLSFADLSATRHPVFLTTEPIEVDVKPAAADFQWWIPAEKLEIFSQWEPSPPVFKAGEAVSRNISIKAVGVADNQLPDLTFSDSGNLKQYPEKPVSENRIENGKVAAVKNIKNVYIPAKPGKNIIPEVRIDWYNVKTGKKETARLPEMEIMVLPGLSVSENVSAGNDIPAAGFSPSVSDVSQPLADASGETQQQAVNVYLWATLSFFAGVFVCYLLFALSRREKKAEKTGSSAYYGEVVKYARHKDLRALRDSIIFWARNKYQDDSITNFKDIFRYCHNPDFVKELEGLSALMYAPQKKNWNEKLFIDAFIRANKDKPHIHEEQKPLPDLYD